MVDRNLVVTMLMTIPIMMQAGSYDGSSNNTKLVVIQCPTIMYTSSHLRSTNNTQPIVNLTNIEYTQVDILEAVIILN